LKSLIFRKTGGLGVAGSNPVAPTNKEARWINDSAGFVFFGLASGFHVVSIRFPVLTKNGETGVEIIE
jgi:hypothetical protein